jgi:hypothetical protein
MTDVTINMEGGRLWHPQDAYDADRPAAFSGIEESLSRRRAYNVSISIAASTALLISSKVPGAQEISDYENALRYNTHFSDIFTLNQDAPGNVTNREFATFFNVLRCFDEDSDRIKSDTSSALKASNFIVYFILPPFFSCHSTHFEFKQ